MLYFLVQVVISESIKRRRFVMNTNYQYIKKLIEKTEKLLAEKNFKKVLSDCLTETNHGRSGWVDWVNEIYINPKNDTEVGYSDKLYSIILKTVEGFLETLEPSGMFTEYAYIGGLVVLLFRLSHKDSCPAELIERTKNLIDESIQLGANKNFGLTKPISEIIDMIENTTGGTKVETKISPIEKWLADFDQQSLEALDRLLMGSVFMGNLNANDLDEILFRLFNAETKDRQTALDEAMRSWLEKYLWAARPPSISAKRWAEILQDAFSTVIRLDLRKTQVWLLENLVRVRAWLRSLYLGPGSDPEADLLRTLALCQRNQGLLPLWMKLCRLEETLEEDRLLCFASIGLMGLQKLPNENGELPSDLSLVVFTGIVDLANAIGRKVKPKKQGKKFWFLKIRALMARYPRSPQEWTKHFLPLISSTPDSTAEKWLSELIPELKSAGKKR